MIGCTYSKHQVGLFVWAAPPPPKGGVEVTHPLGLGGIVSDKILYESNVFITPGGIFGSAGNGYIRVSLCGSIERFEEAIKRIDN